MICSIGWVQALAFSAFGIAVVVSASMIIAEHLKMKHKEEMKRLDQKHEVTTKVHDEGSQGP